MAQFVQEAQTAYSRAEAWAVDSASAGSNLDGHALVAMWKQKCRDTSIQPEFENHRRAVLSNRD